MGARPMWNGPAEGGIMHTQEQLAELPPAPRRDRAEAPRNGLPLAAPYPYQGTGRSLQSPSEIEARIRQGRPRAATGSPPLAFSWATPAEAHHERRDADVRALLATSREARAAMPVPVIIQGRVVRPPITPHGRRAAWYVTPAALAARLAPPRVPPAPKTPRRCRRCGYLRTRCACRGAR